MILGIDPGLANTGWAVLSDEKTLVECGCLQTKISEASAERLDKIYCELEKLIKKYKLCVVINRSPKSSSVFNKCRI